MTRHAFRSRASDETGASLVIMAIAVVMLLMFAGLVIDLGNGRQEKRHVQNGVDAASLGAVKLYDGTTANGTGTNAIAAKTLALKLLKGNGFDVPTTATTADTYTCTGTHSCTIEFGWNNADLNRLCVEVELRDFRVPTMFSRVLGRDALFASARGNGCRRRVPIVPERAPAFYSGSSTCDPGKTLTLSGSNVFVRGTIHSNRDLVISGSNDTFDGPVTYRTTFTNSGSGNTFNPLPAQNPIVRPYPLTWNIADYRPGGSRAQAAGAFYHHLGNDKLDRATLTSRGWIVNNVLQKGIYHTAGEMDLDLAGITHAAGGVTFVAETKATLKWANGDAVPYEPSGLLVFANNQKVSPLSDPGNCTPEGLLVSGQNFRWDGIMYVPRSGVDFSASDVSTPIRGSVLAHSLLVQGQNFRIEANPYLFPDQVEQVFLDE